MLCISTMLFHMSVVFHMNILRLEKFYFFLDLVLCSRRLPVCVCACVFIHLPEHSNTTSPLSTYPRTPEIMCVHHTNLYISSMHATTSKSQHSAAMTITAPSRCANKKYDLIEFCSLFHRRFFLLYVPSSQRSMGKLNVRRFEFIFACSKIWWILTGNWIRSMYHCIKHVRVYVYKVRGRLCWKSNGYSSLTWQCRWRRILCTSAVRRTVLWLWISFYCLHSYGIVFPSKQNKTLERSKRCSNKFVSK